MAGRGSPPAKPVAKARTAGKTKGAGGASKGESPSDPCDITITTVLQGPKPSALASLKVGASLNVQLHGTGSATSVVCSVPGSNAIAGSLAFHGIAVLISCIRNGNSYNAEIITLHGGNCEVLVSRTKSP